VLPAIDFDNQARIVTDKIDDEGADWRLAPKMCAVKSARPNGMPNDSLGVS
jgi:hypothetical protein